MVPAARGVGFGQVRNSPVISAAKSSTLFKNLQVIANASVVSYYTSLIALVRNPPVFFTHQYLMTQEVPFLPQALYYLAASCQTDLPWMRCDPALHKNGTVCVDSGSTPDRAVAGLADRGIDAGKDYEPVSSAEQYFL